MNDFTKGLLAGTIILGGYIAYDMQKDTPVAGYTATAEGAKAFIKAAEAESEDLGKYAGHVFWVQANFVTYDTTALAAKAGEEITEFGVRLANLAKKWNGVKVDDDTRRKLELIKQGLTLPAPTDPAKNKELAEITAGLDATYAAGKYCREDGTCLADVDIIRTMATSRDADELLDVWKGWRTISPPMKDDYARMVEIANEGSKELGYADTGALWRAKYDMDADELAVEADRLWGQVKPMYDSLQCYVRGKLEDQYGDAAKTDSGMIPAHWLGNIWAQQWGNIYDIVKPEGSAAAYDLTKLLQGNGYEHMRMVETGENFFSSLGFQELPETFWERSLFIKPRDRNVQCHASAWNIDSKDDLRIKMCIDVTGEDFVTIHHELGHNYYQRAYNQQSPIYQGAAHDGFHEAIGDFVALSITPSYLKQIGLLQEEPDADKDIGLLMAQALDKIAFLPWGLMVDKWRWQVFSGDVTPENYNAAWWKLREEYQGVSAPVERTEADFDPGAKYHVPGNTPYLRYFFAHILQYQFHQSACEMAGWEGPLHRCSIYDNKQVGEKLNAMLEMGMSKPWPDALEAFSGTRKMDGSAIQAYFAPLKEWLDVQNEGKSCGWTPKG